MTLTRFFLGETTDREKAFPDIISLDLTIAQDRFGHYTRHSWQREQRFSKADIPRNFTCANARCQQGGLDLQQIISFWPPGQHTFHCNGHEGTPKGRRKGNPCDNRFELTLVVIRRSAAETQ